MWTAHEFFRANPIHESLPETARGLMAIAGDSSSDVDERAEAAYTLGRYPDDEIHTLLVELAAGAEVPEQVQRAAIDALIGLLHHIPVLDPERDMAFTERLGPAMKDYLRERLRGANPRWRNILSPQIKLAASGFATGYPPCSSPLHEKCDCADDEQPAESR
ncbi:hypothetical protein [Nocardia sp. NPDC052566]|uniref:hypothetical protein n=1 Tax=Nocardia sp. NPDC052566 TaxID=3364330 RepID=UPI0037C75394